MPQSDFNVCSPTKRVLSHSKLWLLFVFLRLKLPFFDFFLVHSTEVMGNYIVCRRTDDALAMEQEREEGQALLRSMVLSSSEVDWAAVIAKANELHTKEQAWLTKRNRRQGRMFRTLEKRALIKRRKYDSSGSFSVNLLTFRMSDHHHHPKPEATTYVETLSHDDQSYGSGLSTDGWGMARSLDEGMEPIAEDTIAEDFFEGRTSLF